MSFESRIAKLERPLNHGICQHGYDLRDCSDEQSAATESQEAAPAICGVCGLPKRIVRLVSEGWGA